MAANDALPPSGGSVMLGGDRPQLKPDAAKNHIYQTLQVGIVEMILATLAMIPAVFVMFMLYVWALLYVARVFLGFIKNIIAALIYGAFAVLVVTPLYYLISINQPALMEGDNKLLAVVMACYFVVVAPGFYYLISKIGVLRNAGYFKPRS